MGCVPYSQSYVKTLCQGMSTLGDGANFPLSTNDADLGVKRPIVPVELTSKPCQDTQEGVCVGAPVLCPRSPRVRAGSWLHGLGGT